ncbi:myosin-15-like [Ruditapes philippinarum]|uniref:myosin-15-like n=1 Tax=Ruditapes philippinarum TaxID=129788 RepID=UPI00295B70A5|nr:myosin-15-like [Ruditapes philippinarum]
MANFDNLISKSSVFLVLLICQLNLTEVVSLEPMCSKFSNDEQLLEKMVRVEFYVENVQKDSEKSVSNVMDMLHDIQGNNSELSNRLLEQKDKVDILERQTGVLKDTMANEIVVSENKESIRSIAADVRNIRNDLENKTSGLDNLLVITDEINKKCEDGLSDLSKNLERQTNDLRSSSTDFDKQKNVLEDQKKEIEDLRQDFNNKSSEIAAIKESMKNVSVDVANIKNDMKKLDDVKTMKDDLSELSKRLADLEKQMKELDQTTENKTQTIAFNVMDAVNYTGNVIKFSTIILNEGDAYNIDTGIFKAPTDGIYQFNAHICGNKTVGSIEYHIMVGSIKIVTGEFILPNRATDTKCTSFSAVALVRKGENVGVGGMSSFSSLDQRYHDDVSSFSGILIRTI